MGSARISRSTCEFCDAHGTHVQVQVFSFVQTCIRTVPQNHMYQGHSECTAVLVTCVTCVCPPTPHGRVLKCWCWGGGGGGGQRGKKKKKGETFLFQKQKQKTQRDVNSILEGYKTY